VKRKGTIFGIVLMFFTGTGVTFFPVLMERIREQQILATTMTITIIVPELGQRTTADDEVLPIPNDEYRPIARPNSYIVAEGLGALVTQGEERLIITHDHWSLLDSDLGAVQFGNATGELLLEVELIEFKNLIRYRDGGTMVIEAPEDLLLPGVGVLSWLPALGLTDPDKSVDLSPGSIVLVAQRQRGDSVGVVIVRAEIERSGQRVGHPVYRLRSLSGQPIVGGDSGGSVWHEGELVANMWTAIMMENISTGALRPTDVSIVAVFPASSIS
jgi:hypothetical protein